MTVLKSSPPHEIHCSVFLLLLFKSLSFVCIVLLYLLHVKSRRLFTQSRHLFFGLADARKSEMLHPKIHPNFFLAFGQDNRRDEIFRSGIPNVRDGVRAKCVPGASAVSPCWHSQQSPRDRGEPKGG
jgi:hypothetical protein